MQNIIEQPQVALTGPKYWWQKEVFYQIYPASFKDSNNDGIGDIPGIIEKLPYLKKLGITAIWLSPIYQSPMVDNGYDISDYQAINPSFGTMADFDTLMAQAKALDIKIIMDLVINHTSDQHRWFQAALKDPNSPYRDYYIFKPGVNGGPPNNWRSNFGKGSSWTEVAGEANMYYHHVFSPQQPDLNWENPKLRQRIYQMINWWLDKGLAGFRIDAITFIKKDQDFAAITPDGQDGLGKVKRKTENRPGLDAFLTELKQATFQKHDAVTVGEASGVQYDQLPQFIGEKGYFSMIFDFHYADIDVASGSEWYKRINWTVPEFKALLFKSQLAIQATGWGANFLENHDQPRSISKYIRDPKYQNAIGAKALATLYFCLRGTPFIYQGQEIGMINAQRQDINAFNDVSSHDNYQRAIAEGYGAKVALACVNQRSRDNSRTPFQWSAGPNAGFNQGHEPWLGLAQNWQQLNYQAEKDDPASTFNFYRQLIALRNHSQFSADLIYGAIAPLTAPDKVVAYGRGDNLQVYVNLSSDPQVLKLTPKALILNNYDTLIQTDQTIELKPYQAILIEVDKHGN
ncbi:MAG: alpha-glucosidase [Lactobacillus sp.]|jgi:alpha-glucosidase|nr:alpha-glucosidase [Lactobacillus sp.]